MSGACYATFVHVPNARTDIVEPDFGTEKVPTPEQVLLSGPKEMLLGEDKCLLSTISLQHIVSITNPPLLYCC